MVYFHTYLKVILAATLVLICSASLLSSAVSRDESQLAISLALFIYVIIILIPVFGRFVENDILNPVIFLVVWWYVFRDILPKLPGYINGLQFHRVVEEWGPVEKNFLFAQHTLLMATSLLAVYAGYFLAKGSRFRLTFPRPAYIPHKAIIVFFCSVGAIYVLARIAGGFEALLLQRGIRADERIAATIGAHWHILARLSMLGSVLWFSFRTESWRNPLFLFVFICSLALAYMASGSRSGVVLPMIVLVVLWAMRNRKIPYFAVIVCMMLGLLVIGLGGLFRSSLFGADSVNFSLEPVGLLTAVSAAIDTVSRYGLELDGLIGVLARVPEQVGYMFGTTYLSILFSIIPSAVLPFDKPLSGGALNVLLIYESDNNTIPLGSVGEAYWNFGFAGVVVVHFLFGIFLKKLYYFVLNARNDAFIPAIYVWTLFILTPTSNGIYTWILTIVPSLFLAFIFSGRVAFGRRARMAA